MTRAQRAVNSFLLSALSTNHSALTTHHFFYYFISLRAYQLTSLFLLTTHHSSLITHHSSLSTQHSALFFNLPAIGLRAISYFPLASQPPEALVGVRGSFRQTIKCGTCTLIARIEHQRLSVFLSGTIVNALLLVGLRQDHSQSRIGG